MSVGSGRHSRTGGSQPCRDSKSLVSNEEKIQGKRAHLVKLL